MKAALLTIGIVAILLVPTFSYAQEKAPSQLVGVYECEGQNPDGSTYKGLAEIVKIDGTFRVHWILGDFEVWGVGIWSNGVFAVSYFGGAPAVVVYKVDGNRLVGEWTMGGVEGGTYSEVLTKTDKRPSQHSEPPATPSPRPQPGRVV